MKRIALIIGIIIISVQFGAFSQNEKPSIKESRVIMNEMITLIDALTKKLENNKSEQELIEVVEAFTPSFKKIIDKFKAHEKKYPEFKTDPEAETALKELGEKMVNSLETFGDNLDKVSEKYPESEKLKESLDKMEQVIGEMMAD
jgi:hypothetical protein